MRYSYNAKVVNVSDVDHFFDQDKFIGYILPNGDIYGCVEHNVPDVVTIINMAMEFAENNYDLEVILNDDSKDMLMNLVVKKLRKMKREELINLRKFMQKEGLIVSDLLVQFFGCHDVTRGTKTIITSDTNLDDFLEYRIMGFNIKILEKIEINDKGEFTFVRRLINDKYSELIESIRRQVPLSERPNYFHHR